MDNNKVSRNGLTHEYLTLYVSLDLCTKHSWTFNPSKITLILFLCLSKI